MKRFTNVTLFTHLAPFQPILGRIGMDPTNQTPLKLLDVCIIAMVEVKVYDLVFIC